MNRLIFISRFLILFPCIWLAVCCHEARLTQEKSDAVSHGNLTVLENRISVALRMNDSIPIQIFFDSGTHVWLKLSEKIVRYYTKDSSQKNESESPIAPAPYLQIDTASLFYPCTRINDLDTLSLFAPYYPNEKRIWDFNLDRNQLTLYHSDTIPPGAIVLPLQRHPQALFVELPVGIKYDSITIQTNDLYMLDTGCPFSFYIQQPQTDIWRLSEKLEHIDSNLEYAPRAYYRTAHIPKMTVADAVEIPESYAVFCNMFSMQTAFKTKAVGMLGMDLLKYFNFMIDLKNDRLILSPNHVAWPPTKLRWNRLGIYLDQTNTVFRMDLGSVADRSGILLGDRIVSLNDIDMTYSQQDSLMNLPQQSYTKAALLREEKQVEIIFH